VDKVAALPEDTVILAEPDKSGMARQWLFSSRPLPSSAALSYLAAPIAGA
jgi:hypothetical protein